MTGAKPALAGTSILELTSFKVAGEEFGIDIRGIEEIVRMSPITQVPRTPPHIAGVINLRGRIVPVVDLRSRLGFAPQAPTKATRIIITSVAGISVGLIVDAVTEVLRLDASMISPPPEFVADQIDASFFRGVAHVGDRLLTLFSLLRLLEIEEASVKLGETLISLGFLNSSELDEALSAQAVSGSLLGKILLDKGACTKEQLEMGLALQKDRQI